MEPNADGSPENLKNAVSLAKASGIIEQIGTLIVVPILPTEEMIKSAWASAHAEDAVGVWLSMLEEYCKIAGDHEKASVIRRELETRSLAGAYSRAF